MCIELLISGNILCQYEKNEHLEYHKDYLLQFGNLDLLKINYFIHTKLDNGLNIYITVSVILEITNQHKLINNYSFKGKRKSISFEDIGN